jgi:hypothetical protein
MSHEEHHQETPKKVYFGIPFAFAFVFWFIVFLSLKACDGPKDSCKEGSDCCKEKKECCEGAKKGECKENKDGEAKEVMQDKEETTTVETTEPTAEPAKAEEAKAKHE